MIMKYLDTWTLKGVADDLSMKHRVRDHIIFKSEKIWKKMIELGLQQLKEYSLSNYNSSNIGSSQASEDVTVNEETATSIE
jgi:hypothetical protein